MVCCVTQQVSKQNVLNFCIARSGLVLPSPCIFLEGRVFLWEVPKINGHANWPCWTAEHFKLFEVVIPRPGKRTFQLSGFRTIPHKDLFDFMLQKYFF